MKILLVLLLLISGCASKPIEVVNIEEKKSFVLPKETIKPILIEFEIDEINKHICLNEDNLNKFVYNYIEIKRYVLELQNENNSLRKIIKNEVQK